MIFDYSACRKHLPDRHYPVRLKRTGSSDYGLIISQPALLMVCTSLRCALCMHFYSWHSFRAKISTRLLLEGAATGLTMQSIEDRLPPPLKLSNIDLDIEIRRLVGGGFNLSVLVEVGKKIFNDYQALKRNSEAGNKLIDLRWRLVCTDTYFIASRFTIHEFNHDLQLLLEEVHRPAATSASLESSTSQKFGSSLEIWLREERDSSDPTYQVRDELRQYPRIRIPKRPNWWY
jgi:hypothetical protein